MPLAPQPPVGPVSLSQNARTVLEKRYLVRDASGKPTESPEDLFWRVAMVIAEADRRYGATDEAVQGVAEEFYALMTQRRFEPNSPTLMNAGRPLGQLSACFVLPVKDALSNGKDGIYDTLRAMALIHQSGGGTGFSFSRLRPKGSMVRSTTGVASGPVSFMKLYDASTDAVKQGGTRRGANMGILRVDHPDIITFITCKEDLSQVTNFNISVAVTDEFMRAVHEAKEYDLKDPHSGAVVGQLDARMVWDRMILGAWRTGEPGCFFIDEANRYNPVPHLGSYEATNPCVIGSTRLATDRGLLTMDELHRQVMEIRVVTDTRVVGIRERMEDAANGVAAGAWTPNGVRGRVRRGTKLRFAVPAFKTRTNAPVFQLVTEHGYTVTATDNHKFFTPSGPVELKELAVGDEILLQSGEGAWSTNYDLPPFEATDKFAARVERGEAELPTHWSRDLGQLLGWVVADGWTAEETPEGRTVPTFTVGMLFGGDEAALAGTFRARIRQWTGLEGNYVTRGGRVQAMYKSAMYYWLRSLGINEPGAPKRVPAAIWSAPREAVIGFLQAMFTADGTVNVVQSKGICTVRLSGSEPDLLRDVQLLLSNFGIVCKLVLRRPAGRKMMPDGHGGTKEYAFRDQYELIISRENRDRFVSMIGFMVPAKQGKAERWIATKKGPSAREKFTTRVKSIEAAGHEDVYCTTEPETNSIVVSACVTANCGEQPLLSYDVCNLGSVNVGYFVNDGVMDWDALKRDIHLSTHFLDNVIDANKYPLPEIDALSKRIRRIGLGIMGFADALVRLGIAYDSAEGVEFGRKIMAFFDDESKVESVRLAQERSPFPEWARSIWGPDETCARDPEGKRIRPMQMLRNCNVTTIAPTGTISIIAGCSSGLEPLFAVAFMRNQAGVQMPDVNEDFVAIAKREGWYSDALMTRIASQGHITFAEVPEKWQRVFVTANHIAPEWHMRMQAAFQQHCDSAISKTTNFGYTATVDDVRAIYELAYQLKAKGVTVYRDGSRDNQVLSTGTTERAAADREGRGSKAEGGSAAAVKESKREIGELQGTIAELEAEIDRLKKSLYDSEAENLQRRAKRARPDKLRGTTERIETPLGTMFVNITEDEKGQPFEVFINLGKAGGAAMADAEAMGRMISLALRSGIPIMEVHRQLRGIASDRAIGLGPTKVLSVPDAIGIALEHWWRDKQGVQTEFLSGVTPPDGVPAVSGEPVPVAGDYGAQARMDFEAARSQSFMGTCPDCGSSLAFAEGCVKCQVCGFSECG
jgi:ribonucleoside-diphosphate reductase alpha chain